MISNVSTFLFILIPFILENVFNVCAQTPLSLPEVCGPNPPFPPQLSAPFTTCDKATKESLAKRHPDQNLNTPQILKKYGYPFKTYNIITSDGYNLTVYRITGSPKSKSKTKKQAVYLNHGLGAASDNWNFQPGNRNLPFKLADAGYEVWLSNCRGTTYSIKHTTYDANKDLQYWNFSWEDMGLKDVPAVIKKMLEVTKQKKIFYIGHSMGTTQYFVALSEIPKLNEKICAGFMLAPIAYIGHMNNGLRALVPLIDTHVKYQALNPLLMGRIQSLQDIRTHFKVSPGDFCDLAATKCGVCDNLLFALFGYNASQVNNTELPNIFAKYPNNISLKTLAHYAQLATTCKFRKYDYGAIGNQAVYKNATPPDFKLQNIKVPTYFFYGERDNLGPPNDVNITASKLSSGVLKQNNKVNDPLWNHVDFITGKNADKLIYNKILSEMKKCK